MQRAMFIILSFKLDVYHDGGAGALMQCLRSFLKNMKHNMADLLECACNVQPRLRRPSAVTQQVLWYMAVMFNFVSATQVRKLGWYVCTFMSCSLSPSTYKKWNAVGALVQNEKSSIAFHYHGPKFDKHVGPCMQFLSLSRTDKAGTR